ncbi:TolC family outer membrane protein [Caulobacter sp. KR2-114]|uniref:TolC family outer membrane protein n=1 Tax=Caulobacter sp. KR2-114 TaxID=3400912 RepID=UPI003C0F6208
MVARSRQGRLTRIAGVAVGALVLAALGGAAAAETLGDAIALAYQTNPTLQAQRATQRALDETYVQARTGFRPTANVQATISRQLTNQFGSFDNSTAGVSLSIDQPLYTGGRVSSQVSAAEADVLAGRENLRRAEIQVLQSVVGAYLDVRRDQQRLAISQENVAVLVRQLEESKARFDAGEVTRTDVAQTEARLAAAQASLASSQAQLAISRSGYASVVGQNPGDLAAEPPIARLIPPTVDQAFDAAEHNNPLMRQQDYTEQSSAARVAEAKAQTRPSVDLRGTFGYGGLGFGTASPFADYSHNIQGSAVVTMPLFTGGQTQSQIRQAAERNNADRINIEAARRQVLLDVSQAWNQLLGSRANVLSNEEQVRAAGVAYEGIKQEESVGLRTTLDVLNQEQELRNAELALVTARHDEYVSGAAVLAAMGALDVKVFAPDAATYDPKANFDKVRHSFGWTPWEPAVEALDHVAAPRVIERPAPSPEGQVVPALGAPAKP